MKERFKLKYSAPENDELDVIRSKYVKKETQLSKMDELRRLDASAENKATVIPLVVGTVGTLILGLGMSCAMVWNLMALGIVIGVIGILIAAIAYPLYQRVLKKHRDKIAPDVLRLIDEIKNSK
ncbi:MAG: hypothetical protein IJ447_03835 [Clostridia bacterium]|nr:hypothetical protein [Clostridia bacterium]